MSKEAQNIGGGGNPKVPRKAWLDMRYEGDEKYVFLSNSKEQEDSWVVASEVLQQGQGYWERKVQYFSKGLIIPPISLVWRKVSQPSLE